MMIETERLIIRKMNVLDYNDLCKIIQDKDVMYAYEGPYNDEQAKSWLLNQIERQKVEGFGLNSVILKETGKMIGQCGLTMQCWRDDKLLEIGYLFQKAYWHKGYATEAAIACKEYAFNVLGADKVHSIIRDTNIASQNVAKRNGMHIIDKWTKHFRNVDMPHFLFCVENDKKN